MQALVLEGLRLMQWRIYEQRLYEAYANTESVAVF